jgi:3-hydroxymyristoyl/3-hydroxydecanoyl-(acyl carrier protein) dehydratase
MATELDALLPHRPPLVMIDRLVDACPESARAQKTFFPDSYGADGDSVCDAALVECLAQTVAAAQGETTRRLGLPPERGMLVGVSGFRFHRQARLGEPLELSIEIVKRLGAMILVNGRIAQNGNAVADGTLKFFVGSPDDAP